MSGTLGPGGFGSVKLYEKGFANFVLRFPIKISGTQNVTLQEGLEPFVQIIFQTQADGTVSRGSPTAYIGKAIKASSGEFIGAWNIAWRFGDRKGASDTPAVNLSVKPQYSNHPDHVTAFGMTPGLRAQAFIDAALTGDSIEVTATSESKDAKIVANLDGGALKSHLEKLLKADKDGRDAAKKGWCQPL